MILYVRPQGSDGVSRLSIATNPQYGLYPSHRGSLNFQHGRFLDIGRKGGKDYLLLFRNGTKDKKGNASFFVSLFLLLIFRLYLRYHERINLLSIPNPFSLKNSLQFILGLLSA